MLDPWKKKLRPIGVSKTQTPENLRSPGVLWYLFTFNMYDPYYRGLIVTRLFYIII